jgi:hypothetical protein
MTAPTFEEAKRCPRCDKPGEDRKQMVVLGKSFKGGKAPVAHTIYCVTELCPWYNTPWIVQVNGDGTIPPPQDHSRTQKEYVGDFGTPEEAKALIDSLRRQAASETKTDHTEIPNRGF